MPKNEELKKLFDAIKTDDQETAEKMVRNNKNLLFEENETRWTAVEVAMQNKRYNIVQLFTHLYKNKGEEDSARYGHALLMAVRIDNEKTATSLVDDLLAAGPDTSWSTALPEKSYCLHLAISKNRPNLIQQLLKHFPEHRLYDRNGDDKTPMQYALEEKRYDCICALASQKVKKPRDASFDDALLQAVKMNNSRMVEALFTRNPHY